MDMRRLLAALLLVSTGLVMTAPTTASYALTMAQSGALAAKARTDATARAKLQAAARARTEALAVKARTDAAAKSKATGQIKLNIRAETRRRVEAANTAAKLNRQVVASRADPNAQSPAKPDARPPHHLGEPRQHHDAMHAHHTVARRGEATKNASAHRH
jgi:hypothetical protein